jgi:hypothetical protein
VYSCLGAKQRLTLIFLCIIWCPKQALKINRRVDLEESDRRCAVGNSIHGLSHHKLWWSVNLAGIPTEPSNRHSRRDNMHECLCSSVLTRLSDSLYTRNYSSGITIHSTMAVIYIHTSCFDVQKLCILSKECICVFHLILGRKRNNDFI